MKSNKWILGLLTVVLVLALAPSGFAQNVQLSLLNTASKAEIAGNHMAQTSDPATTGIILTASVFAASSNTQTGNSTLVLTFPGPITSGLQLAATINGVTQPANPVPTGDAVRISGATGIFGNVNSVVSIGINTTSNTITLVLPTFGFIDTSSAGFLIIQGVRISLPTSASGVQAISSATITNPTGNPSGYVVPATMPTLITAVLGGTAVGGIGSTGTSNGTATIFTNQSTAADPSASVLFNEPFSAAWRTAVQNGSTGGTPVASTGANNSTQLKIFISNNFPAGMSAQFTAQTIAPTVISPTTFTLTSTSTSQLVSFTTTDLNAIDRVGFDIVISGVATATLPLTAGSVTVSAALAPMVATLANGGDTTVGDYAGAVQRVASVSSAFPRYEPAILTTTFLTLTPLQSTMLLPYALRQAPYETAFAIANTSKDPFASSGGSAVATDGNVQFWLFPNTTLGACTTVAPSGSCTVTTNSTNAAGAFAGRGLNTSGNVASGGTFTATMSMLLSAAGMTGDFVGYIFVQTGFPNAHGTAYVFVNGNLSSATDIGVVANPSITSRTGAAAESLGF